VLNSGADYLDGWFPRGDVSLIAAPSGGGKSTLMIDLLEKQLEKRDVFGHTTNGLPYLVLMEDRSENSLIRTLARMRVAVNKFPHAMLDGNGSMADRIQRELLKCPALPAIVFLEGIDLAGDASDGKEVSKELKRIQLLVRHYHIALIGSTGCPKQKPKDG